MATNPWPEFRLSSFYFNYSCSIAGISIYHSNFYIMKTIKYIFTGMVILSMTLGSFSSSMGQDVITFSETYKSKEIMSLLDSDETFVSLLNREQADPENSWLGSCADSDSDKLWNYLHRKEVRSRLPEDLRFAWGWEGENGSNKLYVLKDSGQKGPGQKDILSVEVQDGRNAGNYAILLEFSGEGADRWARMTKENVGRNIAIVIENKVAAAPMVRSEIRMGKCQITGDFNREKAMELKSLLGF